MELAIDAEIVYKKKYDADSFDESNRNIEITKDTNDTFMVSSKTYTSYFVYCYVITKFISKCEYIETSDHVTRNLFEYDYGKSESIITHGNVSFIYKNNIYLAIFNADAWKITFKTYIKNNINDLKNYIDELFKTKNPYKNKLLYYISSDEIHIKLVPDIEFNEIILDESMKNDIYDNTIYHLDKMESNNGIILYGIPGTGKSLICSAVTKEAIEKGYTVLYLTNAVNFVSLNAFIKEIVGECVVILEDVDSYAISRESMHNSFISEFLQFINGITESESKIVFIATTNYLDKLDSAISNRPVRFNRKYHFSYPSNQEINKLIELYFNKNIAEKYGKSCHNLKFTGAHIREINRTANLLINKSNNKLAYDDVFMDALELVKNNFSLTLSDFGFKE